MNRIKKREGNYTQVSNDFLRDNRISFKAKGLFCYMFSMNDDWNFTIKSISTQQKEGQTSVSTALKELKDFGYIKYTKHQDGSGTYYLDDFPKPENPNQGFPIMGKSSPIKKNNISKNKNIYKEWLQELKTKVKIKTKITHTKEGEKLFKNIEDKKKLMSNYVKHQEEKGQFAQRITAFIEDYHTVHNKEEDYTQWSM